MTRLTHWLILFGIFTNLKASTWGVFDVDCPALNIEHGGVKIKNLWITNEAQFWCHPDYVLIGEAALVCEFGKWDKEPPICVPKGIKPSGSAPCTSNNGGCQQICRKRGYCGCYGGFRLSDDMKTCFDIDECSENSANPLCDGICLNTLGSFRCHCLPGTYLDPNGKTCLDINECESNNFNCSHFCANTKGGAFCVCPENFILDTDNKTCIVPSGSNNSKDILQLIYDKVIALEAKFSQQELQMETIMQTVEKLLDHKMEIQDTKQIIPCEEKSFDHIEKDIKRGIKLTEFLLRECSLTSKSQEINLSEQLSLLGNDTKGELHILGTQLKNVSQLVEKLTTAFNGPKPENLFPLH